MRGQVSRPAEKALILDEKFAADNGVACKRVGTHRGNRADVQFRRSTSAALPRSKLVAHTVVGDEG